MTSNTHHETTREHALVDGNLVYGLNAEGYNAWSAQVWDERGERQARAQEMACRWNAYAEMEAVLRALVRGAVLRGRCVWCAHSDDPPDGRHTSTCIVAEAQASLDRIGSIDGRA